MWIPTGDSGHADKKNPENTIISFRSCKFAFSVRRNLIFEYERLRILCGLDALQFDLVLHYDH